MRVGQRDINIEISRFTGKILYLVQWSFKGWKVRIFKSSTVLLSRRLYTIFTLLRIEQLVESTATFFFRSTTLDRTLDF